MEERKGAAGPRDGTTDYTECAEEPRMATPSTALKEKFRLTFEGVRTRAINGLQRDFFTPLWVKNVRKNERAQGKEPRNSRNPRRNQERAGTMTR